MAMTTSIIYDLLLVEQVATTSPWGNLIVDGVVMGRVGVQCYTTGAEYRPPEEVKQSVESLKGLPVTMQHEKGMVSPNNLPPVVGSVADAWFDEQTGLIKGSIHVWGQAGIDGIKKKTHNQLSLGYARELVDERGEWIDTIGIAGEPEKKYSYTGKQTKISPNHLSLVNRARAGNITRIILDSASESLDTSIINLEESINDTDMSVKDEKKIVEKNDQEQVDNSINELTDRLQEALTDNATLRIKLDALEKATLDADVINQQVIERVAAIAATTGTVVDSELLTKSPEEIYLKFLNEKLPSHNFDSIEKPGLEALVKVYNETNRQKVMNNIQPVKTALDAAVSAPVATTTKKVGSRQAIINKSLGLNKGV